MKTIELSTSVQSLAACAEELHDDVIFLTMNERPVAVLVPLSSSDSDSWKHGMDPKFVAIIDRARDEVKAGKKNSLDDLKREFGLT